MEEIFKIHCNKCGTDTIHKIFVAHSERRNIHEIIDYRNYEFWEDVTAVIYRCGGCGEFLFKKYRIWCEDGPDFPEKDVIVLPERNISVLKTPDRFQHVPSHIISLYREIIDAAVKEMVILCSAGIRAIIEAICNDKGIEGATVDNNLDKNLRGKIMGLCEKGYLTLKHAKSLLYHKFIGDKALHELRNHTKEELVAAIDIIAHTLDSVYELDNKVNSWNETNEKKVK
ncbi:MAG TPA: DUF4145 domain-containing protein [Flavobacteriales bacterium]|nr:DUF4145 domain-containing protein [Flavobacteriales bacterium]HRE95514.1 DUF4145 domain-containing protein [Flavobacteriales bacterium]HRJ38960.1 DUF4145 domain-containing protein [Flavobacteriales bacterium]